MTPRPPLPTSRRVFSVLLVLGLAACSGPTGGTPGGGSSGSVAPFVVRVTTDAGDKVKLDGMEGRSVEVPGGPRLTLVEIDGDRLTVESDEPATPTGGGDPRTELRLAKGEPVTFTVRDGGPRITAAYEELVVE